VGNYVKNVTYCFSVGCFLNKPGYIIRLFQALNENAKKEKNDRTGMQRRNEGRRG